MNLPALGNVAHAQGYDLPTVGTPLHLSHSGSFHDLARSHPIPIQVPPLSNPPGSIPLVIGVDYKGNIHEEKRATN